MGRLTGRTELTNKMLRHIYAVNNAGTSARDLQFFEMCRENQFLKIFRECTKFLEVFFVKQNRQGKQHLEATEWKIKHANDSKSVFCGLFRAKAERLPRRYSAPSAGSGPGLETARLRSA